MDAHAADSSVRSPYAHCTLHFGSPEIHNFGCRFSIPRIVSKTLGTWCPENGAEFFCFISYFVVHAILLSGWDKINPET